MKNWMLFALVALVTSGFMSCGDDDDKENGVVLPPASNREGDVEEEFIAEPFLAFTSYVKSGGEFYGFVGLDETQSSEGAKIDSVIYYLDEVRCSKVTEEVRLGTKKIFPFSFKLAGNSFGYSSQHSLQAYITCSGKVYKKIIDGDDFEIMPGTLIGLPMYFQVLNKNHAVCSANILVGSKHIVKNGSDFDFFVWGAFDGDDDYDYVVNAKLYWDGTLVKNKTFYNTFIDSIGCIAGGPGEHKVKLILTHWFVGQKNEPFEQEYEYNLSFGSKIA